MSPAVAVEGPIRVELGGWPTSGIITNVARAKVTQGSG